MTAWHRPWSLLGTLERRVSLTVTVLLVMVIGGMFWLSHARVVDAVSSSELARMQASADQLAKTLTTQARALMTDAARTSALPELRAALDAPAAADAIVPALERLRGEAGTGAAAHALALVDRAGRVVVSTDPADAGKVKPGMPTELETASGPVVGQLVARGDSISYAIAAPVTGLAGQKLGYVIVTRRLAGAAGSASLMGGLVGHDARVLIGNADGSVMTDLERTVKWIGPAARAGSPVYRDPAAHEVIGTTAAVAETPWMVVVEAPRAGILAAASDFTRRTALIGIMFVLVGALLSWILIRRTMRPLGEVTDAAREIAAGNLARRTAIRGRSEIAMLGEAFNQMVERVDRSASDLASRATQLERSNKELNESEAKYRSLFEHLPDGVIVHRDNEILFANPAAIRLLGLDADRELVARPMLEFVAPADREVVRRRIADMVATSNPAPTLEVRLQRTDRRMVTVEATSMPLRVNGVPSVQTILHDVSERRLLEEQFRQSQKMDAVGRLAGGVAHDFNNLLTVIQAHAEFALSEGDSADSRRRDIEEIRKTAESAARLTRQLLTFSRKQSVVPASLDLNDAVTGMLGMIQRLIGDNIEVVTVAGEHLDPIWADPGQIQQVLLNLAVNARDAMPDGGVLRFETANLHVGEGYISAAAAAIPPGDYVMLAVQDTGVGMTEEVRSRVFEPFFTTKQAGRGTGLGLSTVYGIVTQAGGHIWVYSEPGIGTAFKVFFPPHRAGSLAKRGARPSGAFVAAAHGHLLVVEDDASVRAAIVRALRNGGFTVSESRNADEALDVLKREPGIDLMITDMMMPGKPGITLLAEARIYRPDLPAIVLSGYSEQPGTDLWRMPEQAVFVEKPVSPGELIKQVSRILASRTGAAINGTA
jgi:PAS domain S-box-containing protein